MEDKVYERFFHSVTSNIGDRIKRQIKDSNNMRSNAANPHFKSITFNDIPRLSFSTSYGRKFEDKEILEVPKIDSKLQRFSVSTLQRLCSIIDPAALLKSTKHNDTLLICPWMVINKQYEVKFDGIDYPHHVEKGRLVIPIKRNLDNDDLTSFYCFFPCGGLDEDDSVPQWVKSFSVESLDLTAVPLPIFNEEAGVGTITFDKKDLDMGRIPKDQDISESDIIRVRGEYYTIRGWSNDSFNRNFKSVRFTEKIKKKC